ncbi:MAG: hypothetical protein EOO09_09995, partial [Chitinophagaceae bacterium]
MKRLLAIALAMFCVSGLNLVSAQTVLPGYGAPAAPVNVCNSPSTFLVRISGGTSVSPDGHLAVNLPTGFVYVAGSASLSAGGGSVTETSHSGNTAQLSLSNIPAAPGYTEISYQAYATCVAMQQSLSINSQVSYDFYTSTLPVASTRSNSFNTQSASLNIPNITNSSYFGSAGDNYTRNINIVNNGYGSITEFTLADTSGSGLHIRGISVSGGWTILSSKTLVGADTVTTFSFSGGILSQGQTITLVENVAIVSNCFLQSRIATWFGCDSSPCTNESFTGKATAGATVNNSFLPSLRVIADLLPLNCRGTAVQQQLRLTNTGSVRLNELALQLFSTASSQPASMQAFNAGEITSNQSAFSNFQFKLGLNGMWASITPTGSVGFSSPAVCLGGQPGSVSFAVPVINPGDTVYLRYNEINCAVASPANGTISIPGSLVRFNYNAPCAGRTEPVSTLIRNAATTSLSVAPHFPSALFAGVPATIAYEFPLAVSPTYVNVAPDQSTIRFELTLPSNVTFSGSASDLSLVSLSTGAPLAAATGFSYDAVLHRISATYNITASFRVNSLQGAGLRVRNVLLDCALPANGNQVLLNTWLRTSPACAQQEWISSHTAAINLVCPVACSPAGGLNFSSYSAQRSNLGTADNDNNGVADASGVPDPAKIRRDLSMPGDTILTFFTGRISRGALSPAAFTNGYAIDTFTTGASLLTAISANVQLFTSGSAVPFYIATGLPVISSGNAHKVDFSISTLNSFSVLPGGYTAFNDGDSITVSISYRVSGNPGSTYAPVAFGTHFFVSDQADPAATADQYSCNPHQPGSFSVVGYAAGTTGTRTYTQIGSGNVATEMDHYFSIGGNQAGSKPFVNEYRPVTIHRSLRYTVPAGSEYVSATATYYYTTGSGVTSTRTATITPLSAAANPLVFDLEALFNNGTFPRGDQGNSITTTVTIRPTCDVVPRSASLFEMLQVATPGYNTGFPDNTINVADSIYFVVPDLLVSTANTTPAVTDNNVSWEIQVSNSSLAQALRVWMGRTNASGSITIGSVQRLSGPGGYVISTVPLSGSGLYQLGTLTQTSNYYRINATFTSCVKDSFTLAYWYDCNNSGYPSSVAAATHKQTITLAVIPLVSSLQTDIITEPVLTPAPNACDVLTYEIETTNSGSSAIGNLQLLVGPSAGLGYVNGTFQFEYPAGSGSWTTVADVNVTPVTDGLLFSIPSSDLTALYSQQALRFRFGVSTSCAFTSGGSISFASHGTAFCGTAISSDKQQSQAIPIRGVPTATNDFEIHSYADVAVQDCVTGDVFTTYHFSSINLGPLPTSVGDGFNISLPAPWQMDIPAITFPHDPAGASYTGVNAGIYNFLMGEGVAIGDSVVMSVTIRVPAPASLTLPTGNSAGITENGVVRSGAVCSSTGVACPVTETVVTTETGTTIP